MEVILLMGLPGSGKTTWAKANYPEAAICSNDHFFEKDGQYKFDIQKAGQASAACMRKFVEVCRLNAAIEGWTTAGAHVDVPAHLKLPETVIVDNCNINVHSLAPYIGVACAYGLYPRIVFVRATGDTFERQLHNVDHFAWKAMQYNLNELLAHWPGIWPKLEPVSSVAP